MTVTSHVARPRATAVICTLGSNRALRAAVEHLVAQSEPDLEVLVVDNDPASGRARTALRGLLERVRVVDEPRRGLSVARNRAIAECSTPVIAFTDDDAEADARWAERLVDVFAATPEDVALVTGRVTAADHDETSTWFEQGFTFDRGGLPLVWRWPEDVDATWIESLDGLLPELAHGNRGVTFPISGGEFGSGNNMAFRRAWFESGGLFDERLGAGTPSRGGEDLDMFRRIALAGAVAVYHPGAIVRHHHRPDLASLTAQAYAYGTGMAASVTSFAVRNPGNLRRTVTALPPAASLLLDRSSPKNCKKTARYPRRLDWAERAGYLAGPLLLARSSFGLRRARRAGRDRIAP